MVMVSSLTRGMSLERLMPRGQREAVPRPDPIPTDERALARRFWRIFRLLVPFAIVVAAIAVLFVARGDSGFHVHMLIATGLGIGLTVLVGTGLMTLVFLSSSSGHDEAAGETHRSDDE
jgi:hypothetical protein